MLKSIFNELKETQKTCQERFQSILSPDDSDVDDHHNHSGADDGADEDDDDDDGVGFVVAQCENEDPEFAALRKLYHTMADEHREMIKSMRGATTVHHDRCKEQLDKLDKSVEQATTLMEGLKQTISQSGPITAKEKHLATLKVLQVLVQSTNTASEALRLVDRAQESQRLLSEKQKVLNERTQAFEKSLSELKQSKREDDEVRNLRDDVRKLKDEVTRYKADLEEAKKREKEVSESLSKLMESTQTLNEDCQKVGELQQRLKETDSLAESRRRTIDGVTETLRRIAKHGGGSLYRDLHALQQQANNVADELKKQNEQLHKEIERIGSENASLRQELELVPGAPKPRPNVWNGTVSTGPFAYPHTMLFLPRPDCDGVYEAYNQGYPCYFLSDESTAFREQIRDNEPVIGTLLLEPEPHIAKAGNKFKLAPGEKYWLCTCAAINS